MRVVVEKRSQETSDAKRRAPSAFAASLAGGVRALVASACGRVKSWTRPRASVALGLLADLARPKPQLVAENALLRHQLVVLLRQVKRPYLSPTDRLKLLLWDRSGFWVFAKRLEEGTFAWPSGGDETEALRVTMKELMCVLEGIDLRDTRMRKRMKRVPA